MQRGKKDDKDGRDDKDGHGQAHGRTRTDTDEDTG